MKLLQILLGKRKPRPAEWSDYPRGQGWYVSYQRGNGMDVFYWSGGEDDPCFEPRENTQYFGPFRLPV